MPRPSSQTDFGAKCACAGPAEVPPPAGGAPITPLPPVCRRDDATRRAGGAAAPARPCYSPAMKCLLLLPLIALKWLFIAGVVVLAFMVLF